MSLRDRIEESIGAGQAGIWIRSHEHTDALRDIADVCAEHKWELLIWDAVDGSVQPGHARTETLPGSGKIAGQKESAQGAVNTLRTFPKGEDDYLVCVLRNGHLTISMNGQPSLPMVQAIQHVIDEGKSDSRFLVVLSFPGIPLPLELQELFWVIDHELPGRDEFAQIVPGLFAEGEEEDVPEGVELDAILAASSGLTRLQAEGAYSLSLIRNKKILPETIWELKSEIINKRGLLQLYRGGETFADLGGLEALKEFGLQALQSESQVAKARGIMLLGVPGAGKSAFAKALGTETDRPTLTLDIGTLMGGLVGQTEENTREALRVVDAMSPCVLFVDELEKSMPAGNGDHDSGVSQRLLGTFLTWMNDHKSDVFFVGTANAIDKLHPAFTRAERFDGIFFFDFPGRAQKDRIWEIYKTMYGRNPGEVQPDDPDWTGAEIKSCCRLAALLGVPLAKAAQQVVPVAVTSRGEIDKLRDWATNRVLDAEFGGLYTRNRAPVNGAASASARPRRRVTRDSD